MDVLKISLFTSIMIVFMVNSSSGNSTVNITKYPHQISLEVISRSMDIERSQICAGSVISFIWSTTAAQCISPCTITNVSCNIRVRAESDRLDSGGHRYTADFVVIHKEYAKESQYDNDIALVRIIEQFLTTINVPLQIYPSTSATSKGTTVTVSGWLNILAFPKIIEETSTIYNLPMGSEEGQPSRLRAMEMKVLANNVCKLAYNETGITINDGVFCLEVLQNGNGSFAVGSPVVVRGSLIGLVLLDLFNPKYPILVANVTHFDPWIWTSFTEFGGVPPMHNTQNVTVKKY